MPALATACLADPQLVALIDGALGERELRDVRAHLGSCEACRALVASLSETDESTEPMDLGTFHPPDRIGELRVERLLGQGSMGKVYAGFDTQLDRPVAIKFLHAIDDHGRKRLRIEARAVARLSHPNIVAMYQAGSLKDRPYLVTELVQGQTLEALPLPLPWRRAVALAREVAAGLAAAHQGGVIHRDLKPANVMLSRAGQVKLLDFGLARVRAEVRSASQTTLQRTPLEASALAGTPRYMAPEAFAGAPVAPTLDVYSFGVMLFELLAGRPPHEAPSLAALALLVQERPAPPLRRLAPQVPRALARLVDRCLQREPALRPADGAALRDELDRAERRARAAAPLVVLGLFAVAIAVTVALMLAHGVAQRGAP